MASAAASQRSLAVWAIYTLVVGVALLVVPNALLGVFHIQETDESWVRVVGVVVLVLSIYYTSMGRIWSVSRVEPCLRPQSLAAGSPQRPSQSLPSQRAPGSS